MRKTMPKTPDALRGFDYRNVELGAGHWKRQRDQTIETYLGIPDDDLLHIFRQKAGLRPEGHGLAGWYGAGASTFGQKLGAFAKLHLVTGDDRLKQKALRLADGWAECAEISDKLYDHDTYVYDKLLGGFLDLYEYLDYGRILPHLSRLTQAARRRFKKDIKRDGLQDRELWSNRMIEWYTLPENLYRAYLLTGDEDFADFAREWDYAYLWDKLLDGDFRIGPRHAYSQVNSLSSAARAYEATGDERYLNAMKIAYDEITAKHTFATGGYGPAECLFADAEGYLGDSLKSTWDASRSSLTYTNFTGNEVTRDDTWGSCEVSCCAWAVFKLCHYLLRFTGEAKYGEWAERMLYNGTGAQLPVEPGGKVMYYANYFLDGGIKTTEDRRLQEGGQSFEWQCCTGTFPQDVAEYANMLYYRDEGGLYVSQYLPSRVSWNVGETQVELRNESAFPENEAPIVLTIGIGETVSAGGADEAPRSADRYAAFALRLRIPSWADERSVLRINGERQDAALAPGQWAVLDRKWRDGDRIELDLPFALKFKPVDAANPEIAALTYGPLVLAADAMTRFVGDAEEPADWISPLPASENNEPYRFETRPGHVAGYDHLTRTFTPYYRIPAMRWYYMYNRITAKEDRRVGHTDGEEPG
ncbi:glycoside hydrolase family 127 protein [Saccharibacillus sp. CPCC 101409]|uniref:beta-L-arabinofuranosidase domain-containing protein n=1 Tax=Saccharibacillus sp. CPCC 101409 TaxID=3058041 RepID=UPI0026739741|nr:beta-L-arabinofuranosidase domain-containing protein [Saccharibacillus sp. CPCC 101409]MDO3409095.1 glycoside hydrolase family 127 protein [Saccharibacillus sp. CPCC 101409]